MSQSNGDIGCSFYEIGPKGNSGKMLIDTCLCTSINNGQSFYHYFVVTDNPWDPAIDAPLSHGDPNVTFIGDYFGLDASASGFYPLWTDTRTSIQELFTNLPLSVWYPPWKYYAIAIYILFGIVSDGGGVYIDANGHIHIVPPGGPGDPGPYYTETLLALSSLKAAEKIKGNEGRQMQKQVLRSIIGFAQKQLKKLDVGKRAGKKT